MTRYTALFVVAVAIVFCNCAIDHSEKVDSLKDLRSDEAGFQMKVPCESVLKRSEEDAYKNGIQVSYSYRCSKDDLRLLVSFLDHNPDAPAPLETLFGYATGNFEFATKSLNVEMSEMRSIGGFPAKSYVIKGNGKVGYGLVTTNEKGSLTISISFPDDAARPTKDYEKDRLLAQQIVSSVAYVRK
ncbi:MAG: hypothetical protein KA746_14875 [Pyrinomonadaceae bacterium]|nr:hypothetical protein [Pyrinomonadaceae bacterium]